MRLSQVRYGLLARTARRLLPRRRILAAAASLPLLLGAFTAVAAATAPAAEAATNICLTYDTSYCMAYYPPDLGLSGSGIYGVHPSECSSTDDCGWNLIYEGYWSADGVTGSEYELQTAGNTHYCAASTSMTSSYVGFAACGANGTVWVADANDAAGEYLISRFELNHNPPSGLSNASIILVYSPADSVEASIGYEWQTGGTTLGRWNI
jgi:hypothetical protein